MLSTICFILDQSKILSSVVNGLNPKTLHRRRLDFTPSYGAYVADDCLSVQISSTLRWRSEHKK